MDTTGSLMSLSPSYRHTHTPPLSVCHREVAHTGKLGDTSVSQGCLAGHQQTHATTVSALAAQPAFLFFLLLAKHKYLFIPHAETTGVGSRGDTGLGLCGAAWVPYLPTGNQAQIHDYLPLRILLSTVAVQGDEAQKVMFLVLWQQCPSGTSGSKGTVGSVSVGEGSHVLPVLCHALCLSQSTSGVLLLQQHQFSNCEWKVSSLMHQHSSILPLDSSKRVSSGLCQNIFMTSCM